MNEIENNMLFEREIVKLRHIRRPSIEDWDIYIVELGGYYVRLNNSFLPDKKSFSELTYSEALELLKLSIKPLERAIKTKQIGNQAVPINDPD